MPICIYIQNIIAWIQYRVQCLHALIMIRKTYKWYNFTWSLCILLAKSGNALAAQTPFCLLYVVYFHVFCRGGGGGAWRPVVIDKPSTKPLDGGQYHGVNKLRVSSVGFVSDVDVTISVTGCCAPTCHSQGLAKPHTNQLVENQLQFCLR